MCKSSLIPLNLGDAIYKTQSTLDNLARALKKLESAKYYIDRE